MSECGCIYVPWIETKRLTDPVYREEKERDLRHCDQARRSLYESGDWLPDGTGFPLEVGAAVMKLAARLCEALADDDFTRIDWSISDKRLKDGGRRIYITTHGGRAI